MKIQASKARKWVMRLSKKQLISGTVGLMAVAMVVVQLLYPSTQTLPWASIDGLSVGVQSKATVARQLDKQYEAQKVALYFGDVKNPQYTPKSSEFGLSVSNSQRLEKTAYPWYLRLVPTSLFWAHFVTDSGHPSYRRDDTQLTTYLNNKVGKDCKIAPVDASAKVVNDTVVVTKEEDGGICDKAKVTRSLQTVRRDANLTRQKHLPTSKTFSLQSPKRYRRERRLFNRRSSTPGATAIPTQVCRLSSRTMPKVTPEPTVFQWLSLMTSDAVRRTMTLKNSQPPVHINSTWHSVS